MLKLLKERFGGEALSGMVLMVMAVLAMVIANSPLRGLYEQLLATKGTVGIGTFEIAKPILLWINDGLMAVFFLMVGLEVKREMLGGQLSSFSRIALPGVAAIGGMLVPALCYVALNRDSELAMNGWAIPAATDIAFALGILALVGRGVPPALKLFLLAVAIFDDLGAIVIIALFYSGNLSMLSLGMAAVAIVVLLILNRMGVNKPAPYLVVGAFLWIFVLKSGVHATLAGVCLAFAIPMRRDASGSMLHRMEHGLHPWVSYAILPIFAFANAGVSVAGLSFGDLAEPIPLGIVLGLVVGKQVGIFGSAWLAIKTGLARLPEGVSWRQLHGVSALCGVGFTMSLFIASLAFEHQENDHLALDRLGILVGSMLSGVIGYFAVRRAGGTKGAE